MNNEMTKASNSLGNPGLFGAFIVVNNEPSTDTCACELHNPKVEGLSDYVDIDNS